MEVVFQCIRQQDESAVAIGNAAACTDTGAKCESHGSTGLRGSHACHMGSQRELKPEFLVERSEDRLQCRLENDRNRAGSEIHAQWIRAKVGDRFNSKA